MIISARAALPEPSHEDLALAVEEAARAYDADSGYPRTALDILVDLGLTLPEALRHPPSMLNSLCRPSKNKEI